MEIRPNRQEHHAYQKEIQEGVKIFDESFKGLQHTQLKPKQQEYEKAIDMSMKALHDLAQAMVNKKMMQLKDKLDKDYHAYLNNPSEENAKKVESDLKGFHKFE